MSLLYKRLPIALTIAISFALVLASCGSSRQEDKPRATVADPRAYAVEALQTMDLNTWWQAYRNPDPELLGKIVDEVAEKQPDGLPTDARKLDTLIRHQIASRYKSYMDDTDEGKAFILDQATTRFADPPMATWGNDGNYAVLDYHVLPGEWKMVSRTSDGLKDSPAVDHPFLKPDVLADSLQRLATAYPDARVYEIYYQYHFGSDLKKIHLSFVPDGSTRYIEGMNNNYAAEPVPWDDLLNGRIDLADIDFDRPMEGDGWGGGGRPQRMPDDFLPLSPNPTPNPPP